ncbi:unnamed protein product, partial [marine sediment metagenome]
MIIEAWVLMNKVVLDQLWVDAHSESPSAGLELITNGVRGFWKDIGTDEVVNVIGTTADIAAFGATYSADIAVIYSWDQGPGFDNLNDWPTIPQG